MSCDWLFVDGSSLIFRAFYGVPKTVRSPDGRLINAARGFLETLTRLIGTRHPRPPRRRERRRLAPGLAGRTDSGLQGATRRGTDTTGAHPADAGHRRVPRRHRHRRARGRGLRGGGRDRNLDGEGSGTVEIVSGDRICSRSIEDPRVTVLYPEKGGLGRDRRRPRSPADTGFRGGATRTSRCSAVTRQTDCRG